jgi:hypothetical protein
MPAPTIVPMFPSDSAYRHVTAQSIRMGLLRGLAGSLHCVLLTGDRADVLRANRRDGLRREVEDDDYRADAYPVCSIRWVS